MDRTARVRVLVSALAANLTEQVRITVGALDLTTRQAGVLRELWAPRTQREVAESLRCATSNVTFVVDKLEAAGLVRREPHPVDRRAKMLHLTESGEQARTQLIEGFEGRSPLGRLSDDELAEFERLLAKVVDL